MYSYLKPLASLSENLDLLLKNDAKWTKDVGAPNPELQKQWVLLSNVLLGLQIMVSTKRLALVKFKRKVIKKYKALVVEVEALKKVITDKKASPESVEK